MKRIALILIASFGLLSIGATHLSDTKLKPFWLGIVRGDGVLIPFAQFDGKKWSNSWPGAKEEGEDEKLASLSDIPKSWLGSFSQFPKKWHYTSKNENKSKEITVIGPKMSGSQCSGVWGLSTNYWPGEEARGKLNSKVGLAVNTDLKILIPKEVDVKSGEGRTIFIYLKTEFEKTEEEEIAKYPGEN